MEMNAVMPPGNAVMQDQMNGNYNGQLSLQQQPLAWSNTRTGGSVTSQMLYYSSQNLPARLSASQTAEASKSVSTGSVVTSPSKSDTSCSVVSSEEMADCNDSGCDSDGTGSANGDVFKELEEKSHSTTGELEEKLDDFIAQVKVDDNDINTNSTANESTNLTKPKSKRKYYMYGDLKLVKPIKDIPPRYLKLLSKLNAEKNRCEGDPIIVPYLPPKPHWNNKNGNQVSQQTCVQHQNVSTNGFNPEAKSFVPSSSVVHDPSIIACGGNMSTDSVYPIVQGNVASNGNRNDSSMYMYQQSVHSAYNCNVMLSQTSSTGVGNQSSSNRCSNANSGDGSLYSMPPSLSTGQACSYPGTMQCPVYYTGPSGPCQGAQPPVCIPSNQVHATPYIPVQNCNMLPSTMPVQNA